MEKTLFGRLFVFILFDIILLMHVFTSCSFSCGFKCTEFLVALYYKYQEMNNKMIKNMGNVIYNNKRAHKKNKKYPLVSATRGCK